MLYSSSHIAFPRAEDIVNRIFGKHDDKLCSVFDESGREPFRAAVKAHLSRVSPGLEP